MHCKIRSKLNIKPCIIFAKFQIMSMNSLIS